MCLGGCYVSKCVFFAHFVFHIDCLEVNSLKRFDLSVDGLIIELFLILRKQAEHL